jgi:NAD-dependent dihydropyrimidine dehydrogenase PreA subunit
MAIRNIIQIDDELCDGCGQCVPSCAEGALQVINGKARLVSDVLCDGLGACLGECPTGALIVIERDAGAFGEAVVARHAHAHAHAAATPHAHVPAAMPAAGGGCPGSRVQVFADERQPSHAPQASLRPHPIGAIPLADRSPVSVPAPAGPSSSGSRLRQWPVQLHLVPPTAPFFNNRHVLLAADCVPVAVGDFHTAFLDGRGLAIACPKLDQHLDVYVDKLRAMIDEGGILSLTVAIMEVPCCGGLLRLASQAMAAATCKVPLRTITVGIRGDILA